MAYRFRRRMRQIGIGYRVKTVIIANELFRNNKKKKAKVIIMKLW